MQLKQRDPMGGPHENLIPLINIVFLILIFFLVASTLRSFDPDDLDLSRAQAEANADRGPNVLLVYADGRLAMAGEVVTKGALASRLAALARAQPDMPLLIAPDRAVPADKLLQIVETAQAAGLAEVKLIVRKRGPGDTSR